MSDLEKAARELVEAWEALGQRVSPCPSCDPSVGYQCEECFLDGKLAALKRALPKPSVMPEGKYPCPGEPACKTTSPHQHYTEPKLVTQPILERTGHVIGQAVEGWTPEVLAYHEKRWAECRACRWRVNGDCTCPEMVPGSTARACRPSPKEPKP